uniref:Uncharacterized protein n=1 Tax=Anguilla anguilla TaxID=7936 RepID=A0A0E9QDK3_ANGAN
MVKQFPSSSTVSHVLAHFRVPNFFSSGSDALTQFPIRLKQHVGAVLLNWSHCDFLSSYRLDFRLYEFALGPRVKRSMGEAKPYLLCTFEVT